MDCIFSWPPVLDCFGWRNEKIAVGFHSLAESELDIAKFVASFDEKNGIWTLQYLGRFDLVDGVLTTWFEKVGFESFSRMQVRRDN